MNRIAALRKERGLTQADLGVITGKTKFAVSKWEAGINEPSQYDIKILCSVLGASSDYLMGHSDVNTRRITLDSTHLPKNSRTPGCSVLRC